MRRTTTTMHQTTTKKKEEFSAAHGGHIPAADAATRREAMAGTGCVTVATAAALSAARARGGAPFAEGAAAFGAADQKILGGALLHTWRSGVSFFGQFTLERAVSQTLDCVLLNKQWIVPSSQELELRCT